MTVSVCIPVYNRAAELDRALRSVVQQTYSDLDIVVVDNASTDDSHAVARQYAAADSRVQVWRNPTLLGKVENWQRCLEHARGAYLKLLFSDDWLAPHAIERAVTVLEARPQVGFVYSGMTWRHADRLSHCYVADADHTMGSLEFLHHSATVADLVPVTTSCVLMRTADAHALFEPRIPARLADDTHAIGVGYSGMLLWRCADRYPEVHHLGEVLAHSADLQTGEVNSRIRYRDRHEMLWWGHRNAFAHFVRTCSLPLAVQRALVSTMFFSTVPLRGKERAARMQTFRQLFPEFRIHHLRPTHPQVFPHLRYRLGVPPDPQEILS
ncbi:glycosyltransferase family 2 protein [Micromonospora sp. RP3T]|uniref:glycosyltransferase family 2 protein n=1 Tax=Micromonospora sp. RP3T TaxID=2135446 RepID=UPI003D764FF1